MSASLLVLCVAAFAMVAALSSGAVGAALPWLDRLAARIAPRHRVRLWLGMAALPTAVAAMALLVSFLPALGLGHDHCLSHGAHHPHLCPHHVGSGPGIVLVAVALYFAGRVVTVGVGLVRALRLCATTSRALVEASEVRGDVHVFPSDQPQAFVLGVLRARVHVSCGLLAMGPEVVGPVLAHERVHARRRHLLWRAMCPVLAVGHLPAVASALRSRLAAAQESAADVEAAETLVGGRIRVAEAIVRLARQAHARSPGLAFTHGDIEARVRALLDDRTPHPAWLARALLLGGLAVPVAVASAYDFIHHGLETLLGALS
ncbi:M48 family metalloprotease [Haliangium sp.]|uniref:M48 family metalloprotease n=1 Tax=Haliangium sp. TaxID=2663208 RepID=UPI003D146473